MADTSPLSRNRPGAAKALWFVIPFGLLFAVIGFIAFWFVTLKPVLRAAASADWPAVECEILASELDSRRGSKGGTNYRAIIRYRYEWAGEVRESDRYDFADGYSNLGVDRMRRAVRAHEPGSRAVCYADPADPAFAVLERDLPKSVWIGAILLLFPAFGLIFVVAAVRGAARSRAQGSASPGTRPALRADAAVPSGDASAAGEVVLRPSGGRVTTFVFLAFFALLWNGVILLVFVKEVSDFRGAGDWLAFLFLLPFGLVGLVMLGLALHGFSRLFAPKVELRLDPSRLRLGERVPCSWRLTRRGVRRLAVRLTGREETTYRRGKNQSTDRSVFHRETVFTSDDSLGLTEGRVELVLPVEGVVPSLPGTGNRIVWELAFDGEIPWRADLDDTFLLEVRAPVRPPAPAAEPRPREFSAEGATLWTVDRLAPGETLVFTLQRAAGSAEAPRSVRLGWFTEGKGEGDAGVVWSETLADFAPGADRGFEVVLPAEPWSFAGKHVKLGWRLEVLDAKGRVLVAAPLKIAPGGKTVELVSLPPEPSEFDVRKRERRERRRAGK